MRTEIAYQNRDQSDLNPLVTPENSTDQITDNTKKLNIPKDPKIKILIIMGVIVLILLIISIFVTAIKKSNPKPTSQPTPTPVNTPSPLGPDGTGNSNIPESYKTKFDVIDKKNQTDVNFNPPQITDDVGR
jgi:hypothetical protein